MQSIDFPERHQGNSILKEVFQQVVLEQVEKCLVKYIAEELIPKAHHWLILHGRYVCKARKPECDRCALTSICRYFKEHQNT